jgi:hypothetical protein
VARDQETDRVQEVALMEGQIELEYDSDSSCIIRIKDLVIPPHTEMLITFGVRKLLLPFEEYPNDPNRGFNIPQMPIFYSIEGHSYSFYSKSLLVHNMEPDFSMPFNVNAVTNALIGLLFINTYNSLVKPSRFLK